MNKWKIFLMIVFMGLSTVFAQQKLEIQGVSPALYLNHQVSPQESLYSIGRLYNISPRELAAFNKIPLDKGLNVGQQLRIPLDKNNFSQDEVKSVLDFFVPLYHTVKQGETLFRLGANYNKVPLELIKKWNNLPSDAVSEGVPLIVGYLRVDKNQSAFARESAPADVAVVEQPVTEVEEIVRDTVAVVPKESAPTVVQEVKATSTGTSFGAGYFKDSFEGASGASNNVQGTAGVFKSTSGWQDGKYYCFNNQAAPGSIVKITDAESGKSVYAKVLDAIPDIKQNQGLILILSNSAADALGKGEEQFSCTVTYRK